MHATQSIALDYKLAYGHGKFCATRIPETENVGASEADALIGFGTRYGVARGG